MVSLSQNMWGYLGLGLSKVDLVRFLGEKKIRTNKNYLVWFDSVFAIIFTKKWKHEVMGIVYLCFMLYISFAFVCVCLESLI
jgi:hypothetical protein